MEFRRVLFRSQRACASSVRAASGLRSQSVSAKKEFLFGEHRIERRIGRFGGHGVNLLHRPADADARNVGLRGEIAIVMAAALTEPSAATIETDERAEYQRRADRFGITAGLLRSPCPLCQRALAIGRPTFRERGCRYV